MKIVIKLFGGLVCGNPDLLSFGLKRFEIEVPQGSSLGDVHQYLKLIPSDNLVSIVDGHAQLPEYILNGEETVAIFPPLAERKHEFFKNIT